MHGPSCPPVYAPFGAAGTSPGVGEPVIAETFYVAECATCHGRPDQDGQEYGASPEAATTAALEENWWLSPHRILYCEDCRPADSWPEGDGPDDA